MSRSELEDDVDRLFACFKCGTAPPESALKEKRPRPKPKGESVSGEASTEKKRESVAGEVSTEKENLCRPASTTTKLRCQDKFSPVVFYGSPQGLPMKRPLRLLKLLHEIRIDLTKQKDYIRSEEVWATFPRQEESMRFARSHSQVFVFSYQDHYNGQRRFLASTYEEFWKRYKSMDSKVRHHYEVIQEILDNTVRRHRNKEISLIKVLWHQQGVEEASLNPKQICEHDVRNSFQGFPCHLYFDLEFEKRINRDKNAEEMVDILISVIFDVLKERYSLEGNYEWVVERDSSTEEKFSRHLIIHMPRTAFKDNLHAGAFVSEICSRIENFRMDDQRFEKLYIWKETSASNSHQLFLDNAVYSRNRCFRLAFSSKSGKKSFLLPTGRYRCKNLTEKQVFMESLICRMEVDCDKLLICNLDPNSKKTLNFDYEVNKHPTNLKEGEIHRMSGSFTGNYQLGISPFPHLDNFVESIASSGNVSGKIRSWYWFSEYGLMVYSMSRNRYCERIGREHKSNHVMYIVDFQREGYYQKCYDPDCKSYRSPMRPIPPDIVPDGISLFNSLQIEKCGEDPGVKSDQYIPEQNSEESYVNDDAITKSCTKNSPWWQEATKFADCVENGKEWNVDQEWWMDVEKSVIHIEQQTDQMSFT